MAHKCPWSPLWLGPRVQLGLTTLVQRAAELCGVPVHGERLSFLTLGDRIWTVATGWGGERGHGRHGQSPSWGPGTEQIAGLVGGGYVNPAVTGAGLK